MLQQTIKKKTIKTKILSSKNKIKRKTRRKPQKVEIKRNEPIYETFK